MRRATLLLCLATIAAHAEPAQRVDLQLPTWTIQSQDPQDGTGAYQDGAFRLHRAAKGGNYMLRVFKDLPVHAGGVYAFTYTAVVEGGGSAHGMIFAGDAQGKWDEPNVTSAAVRRKGDASPVRTIVMAPAGTVRFRLDLRLAGADTTATFRDVTLEQIGEQPPVALSPSAAAVMLDGKLDDPLWQDAPKLAPFRVLGEVTRPASVACEARVAVKDGDLYVAYRLAEPNVAGLKAQREAGPNPLAIYADDCAETFLSTDRESYAHVLVNAAGARHWDQQNIGRPSVTWYPSTYAGYAGDWDAKAAVGTSEWTCELRIKLSDLYGHAVGGDQTLYLNVTRHRTQGEEENLTWAPITGARYAVPREFVPITLHLPPLAGTVAQPAAIAPKFTSRLGVPDLLLAGEPVRLRRDIGTFKLPAQALIDDQFARIDAGVTADLQAALAVPGGPRATVTLTVGDPGRPPRLPNEPLEGVADRSPMAGPEAFRLEVAPRRIVITGRTRDGVLRGIATLILMANRARCADSALPALTLWDAPRLPFRGVMIAPSKPAVDLAFRLRLNKLLIYLDSFGGPTVFPFESYPIGGKTWTKAALIELFDYARARGLEPIAYFASWGRVQYLKQVPGMKDLLVDDVDVLQPGYRNLDVANPATHKVMLALQQEILDTLHPQSFCIAMDEAHFGHMVESAAAKAKGWKPSDWYAEGVKQSAALFKARGVKLYLWGDMIDPDHNGKAMDISGRELLAKLPRDLSIFDWKYDGRQEPTVDYPSIKLFTDAGLPTIGASWYSPKSIPRLARSIVQHHGQGLLLTAWNSTEVNSMPAEFNRALALTAWYGWSPENTDLARFPFVPDVLVQAAAHWGRVAFPAGTVRQVAAPEGLTGGDELIRLLGLPAGTDPSFLATPCTNQRGVGVQVFRRDGRPAAVAVAGTETPGLLNGDFGRGLDEWSTQTPGAQFSATVEQGALKVTRVSGNAFARVWQDARLDPARRYVVRFKVKVDGPGTARAWTYSGDAAFKWDEPKSLYVSANERQWTVKEVALPPKYASLRLCFSADGPGTTAWYDDVEVVEPGADPKAAAARGVTIPVNASARAVTFLHATSRQVLAEDDMHANLAKYGKVTAGRYLVNYADGTSVEVPLTYRVNVVAANDYALGRETDPGLFGTLGGAVFFNLPTYTWVNPYPAKPITSIAVKPGTMGELTLLLFGIALD